MRRPYRDESGTTLIEVLVAAFVVVIGILGVMGGFIDSSKATQTAQRQDVASALASQAIEQIRDVPYASQAVDGPYPAGSGPLTSISGPNFTAPAGQTEPLVASLSTSGIDPVTYLDAQTGASQSSCSAVASGHQCATIYRFVSWRRETCPTINLSTILGPAATSGSLLNQVTQLSTSLNSLSTSIAVDGMNPVTGGLGALLGGLLGSVNSAVSGLDTSLSGLTTAIAPAQTAVAGELATLQTAIGALPAGSLVTLDLCSLPNLNLDSLSALTTALAAAQTVLGSPSLSAALAGAGTTLSGIANLSLGQILGGVVGTLTGTLNGLTNTITTSTAAINAALGSLVNEVGNTKSLAQIATDTFTNVQALATWLTNSGAASVQETKRITVAVVLSTAGGGVGLRQPLWISSVSTDPSTGLFL